MQKQLEHQLAKSLAWFAKGILMKHKPFVVAVSGSVGKTSAKEAVFTVLSDWKSAGTSPKNYNTELGVPLSIIGAKAGGKNPFKWLQVYAKAAKLRWLTKAGKFPEVLVLEFGGDHVGDIEYLMKLVRPQVGVLTAIEATHTEFYGTVQAIEEEEGKVITMLEADGVGVVNVDNVHAAASLKKTHAKTITYGFGNTADIQAVSSVSYLDWDRFSAGTKCEVKIKMHGKTEEGSFEINGALGSHSCYAPLAALGAAEAVGMSAEKSLRALQYYVAPKGRMRAVPGLKGTIIIDDTYNSSPAAAIKALDALSALSPKNESSKRVAVLGNMAELGALSVEKHEEVGRHAANIKLDLLMTVGDKAMDIAKAAREAGMPDEKIFEFGRTEEAGRLLQERMKPGDLILVKGSQSSRLERIVKEIMADPRKAAQFLVRQEAEWQD